MTIVDQLALDLPGLGASPPDLLARLSPQQRAVVLDALSRLIVKTIAPGLIVPEPSVADGEADDE
jgi:hypothetical protein